MKQVVVHEDACSVNLPYVKKIEIKGWNKFLFFYLSHFLTVNTQRTHNYLFIFYIKKVQILTCFVFLLLVLSFANSQVDRRLFWGYGEFINVLPPLCLIVFSLLLLHFLFLLQLLLLRTERWCNNFSKQVMQDFLATSKKHHRADDFRLFLYVTGVSCDI